MASDRFVSRGGEKLQAALENFKIQITNFKCLDVGSSTGGFVDCLLQNGASKVYALDTSYGELAWKLRNDPRVVVMERTNILHLEELPPVILGGSSTGASGEATPESVLDSGQVLRSRGTQDRGARMTNKVDLITIDAGWTKLELVLPVVRKFLKEDGLIIALLKPHYETDKKDLVKGVLKEELVNQVKEEVERKINDLGFKIYESMESPILGGAGNKEYLILIKSC